MCVEGVCGPVYRGRVSGSCLGSMFLRVCRLVVQVGFESLLFRWALEAGYIAGVDNWVCLPCGQGVVDRVS